MSSRKQLAFANNLQGAKEKDVPRAAAWMILTLAAMVGAFGYWAFNARLEEVVSAQGKVVPAQDVQLVQTLEGGIISGLPVRNGDLVAEGQVVVHLDKAATGSRLGELTEQRRGMELRVARLRAEAEGSEPVFPGADDPASADLVAAENALYLSRKEAVAKQIAVLEPQLSQRHEELAELDAKEKLLKASRVLLEKELELTRKLASRNAVPEIELIRLERQAAEANGELEVIAASRQRVKLGILEYENRLKSADADFRSVARGELAKELGLLNVVEESLTAAASRDTRTEIRSPVRGVVNRVAITTIGGVLPPGATVMEIVPADDRLLVETRIPPRDVAFVRSGQAASVKLSAYDYSIYGALKGTVTLVSPNTITDQQSGESYYKATVETDKAGLVHQGKRLDILPGMLATVDIQTGEKSVFEYLMKPLNKVRHEALRER
ncbi:MAG: HlyD family type I secretion periplasmic adaptor subunit [Rhizobiaceae bacterium]